MRDMGYGLPGSGRYSQIEREQRWLLRECPADLVDPVQIHDIYLSATRIFASAEWNLHEKSSGSSDRRSENDPSRRRLSG